MNKFTISIIIASIPLVILNALLVLGLFVGFTMGGVPGNAGEVLLPLLTFIGLGCFIRVIVLIANKTLSEKKVFAIITLLILLIPATYMVSAGVLIYLAGERNEENARSRNLEITEKIEKTAKREEVCSNVQTKSLSNPDYLTNYCYDGRYGLNGEPFTNIWQWKGVKIETLDSGVITIEGRTWFYTGLDNPPSGYFFGSIEINANDRIYKLQPRNDGPRRWDGNCSVEFEFLDQETIRVTDDGKCSTDSRATFLGEYKKVYGN